MKKLIKLVMVFLIVLVLINGCLPTKHSTNNNSQLPNPASVFCEEQGGLLEIRTNPDGSQIGYCIFPDESECEEWAFYRGECQK